MAFEINTAKTDFNKNDKQLYFNRVKGEITELNVSHIWCSITLKVGHENPRLVNLSLKKDQYDKLIADKKVGDMVGIRFFLTSRFKNEKWFTTANVLSVENYDL